MITYLIVGLSMCLICLLVGICLIIFSTRLYYGGSKRYIEAMEDISENINMGVDLSAIPKATYRKIRPVYFIWIYRIFGFIWVASGIVGFYLIMRTIFI